MWRSAGPAAFRTALLAVGLLTLAGLGQALLATSAAPSLPLLLRLCAASAGAIAPLALGVGALAGAAFAAARLADEGALLALASLGLPLRHLAPLFALFVLPAAFAQAGLHHWGEPLARSALREARSEALASVSPRSGEAVRVGSWWVAGAGTGLAFTDRASTGLATSAVLEARSGGVLARLGDVDLRLPDGATVHADRIEVPLPLAAGGRVHPGERTTPELRRQIAVSAALGREGYERWLLWKRTLLPVALVPLAVAAGGLARSRRPGAVVGALLIGSWGLIRLLDAQAAALGPALASVLFLVPLVLVAGWAWRR